MATRYYCSSVAVELEEWSERLHKLSSKIDRIPSINKYKLQPHIDELHIIMTELDDRLCELLESCPTVEEGVGTVEEKVGRGVKQSFTIDRNEKFDYDFGG
ncbi:MAG TPA: hypothetical protein DDY20_06485 [Desulfobulbaceae bacterium]|jgi:hypothetical protein|nr:hypothetical protein [Desulfobulbaceae bacterium]